jgi:hypothetical protein
MQSPLLLPRVLLEKCHALLLTNLFLAIIMEFTVHGGILAAILSPSIEKIIPPREIGVQADFCAISSIAFPASIRAIRNGFRIIPVKMSDRLPGTERIP